MVVIPTKVRRDAAGFVAKDGHRQNAGTDWQKRSSQMSNSPTAQQGGSNTPAPQQGQSGGAPQQQGGQQQGSQPIFRDWASI